MTQKQSDKYYIKVAQLCAKNSYAVNLQVGAIIVKDGQIMSDGFNGTPCGFENKCEVKSVDGNLYTLSYVLHAESNAILKCAKLIIQAGIIRVVYLEDYRKAEGLDLLKKAGINVEKFKL